MRRICASTTSCEERRPAAMRRASSDALRLVRVASSWEDGAEEERVMGCVPFKIASITRSYGRTELIWSPLPLSRLTLPTLARSPGNDLNSVAIFEDA